MSNEILDEIFIADGEEFLEHYGVKGMKWGVRRERDESGGSNRASRKTAKREAKELKKVNRQGKKDFYKVRATKAIQAAYDDPNALIQIGKTLKGEPIVATGKQVLTYLSTGGMLQTKMTDLVATTDKDGNYVDNKDYGKGYVKKTSLKD